jgi:hypothetical protein
MTSPTAHSLPPAWEVLECAVAERRTVKVIYHGHERVLCPHALGWKDGRAKALVYQSDGTTSSGPLPVDPRQRWRSLFVDEIEHATLVDDKWETADNYSPSSPSNAIDTLVRQVTPRTLK